MPLAIIKRIILCYNKYNSYFIQFLDNYFRHSNYQRKTNFQNGMKITLITVTYNSEKYLAHWYSEQGEASKDRPSPQAACLCPNLKSRSTFCVAQRNEAAFLHRCS